jgi:hypothetical protein
MIGEDPSEAGVVLEGLLNAISIFLGIKVALKNVE